MVDHTHTLGLDPESVVLGGASAGANPSAGAAVALRDRATATPCTSRPAALVFAYPLVHALIPQPSREAAAALAGVPADRDSHPP